MSYPVNNLDLISINIRGTTFGQQTILTTHWQYAGPTQSSDAVADAARFQFAGVGGINSLLSAVTPNEWISWRFDFQKIVVGRYRKLTLNLPLDAGSGGATSTANLAVGLTLHGNEATRRSQGTKHIILPDAALVGGSGLLDGGYVANVGLLADALKLDQPNGAGLLLPVIWGRPRAAYVKCGVSYPALPPLITPITGYSVGSTIRVMRRRTVGVGV